MRKTIIFLFCAALTISSRAQSVKKLTILDLESYIDHCDHPLIVSFWATYCTPCIKEIPYLQSTVEQYKKNQVELLLVSLDRPDQYPTKISAFAENNNYKANLAWLNETNAQYFCPKIDKRWTGGIPSSLFVNNSKHYRKFFDRQLTDLQVEKEMRLLVEPLPPASL